jgi:hypothetical protein
VDDAVALAALISEYGLEFHQRATAITGELKDLHQEIRPILLALRALQSYAL